MSSGSRVVYSTGQGRVCPACGFPTNACRCKALAASRPAGPAGPVRVSRLTQGRGGKPVTAITGLGLPAADLDKLARELKQRCGSGGRVAEGGVIEIQGEHRDTLVAELARRGIAAKRAGG